MEDVRSLLSLATELATQNTNSKPDSKLYGLVLFGSRANAPQSMLADIDCLAITCTLEDHVQRAYQGAFFDILFAPLAEVKKSINRSHRLNNNFYLDVLANGQSIDFGDGILSDLVLNAKQTYKRGPPSIKAADLEKLLQGLRIMFASAKAERLSQTPLAKEFVVLCSMRLDQTVKRSLRVYVAAQNKWTTNFPRLIAELRELRDPIVALWDEYVVASGDCHAKALIGKKLIDTVILKSNPFASGIHSDISVADATKEMR